MGASLSWSLAVFDRVETFFILNYIFICTFLIFFCMDYSSSRVVHKDELGRGAFLRIMAFIGLIILGLSILSFRSYSPHGSSSGSQWALLPALPSFKDLFSSSNSQESSAVTTQPLKIVSEESQVIDVVKKSTGAVVSILASSQVPKLERCIQTMPGFQGVPPEFRQFFNFDIPTLCQNGTEQRQVGAASGFLVSPDGYIVTNRHVVSDEAGEYTVVLNDQAHLGQKMKATILARDPSNDVAVLKIDGRDLPYLNFSDSSAIQVGQTAIAIGYALGEFDNTVTKGVVSGLSRSIRASNGSRSSEQLRGLIQTDAAINPGNSGGPLIDIGGNVIGMNTAVANAQGIGFAIPGNYVKMVYDQVRTSGKITVPDKPFLGVRFQPITPEVQAANRLPYDYGMLVVRGGTAQELAVMPGSPADKAGLQENDIILEADGRQLNERYLLSDAVESRKIGETISLKVFSKGAVKTVDIKLEKK